MPRLPDLTTQERPIPRPPGGITQLESRTGMEMIPSEQLISQGREFSQLGQALQKQLDDAEIDSANTLYDEQRRQVLFGPEGFYTKKGKDALNAMQPTSEAIEKLRSQVRNGLANKEQKKLYDYMTRRSTQADLRSMSLHAVNEGNRYSLETNKAALINEVNNSGTYWNDLEQFGASMGKIKFLVEQGAKLTGQTDPESIKAATTHWTSEAWQARIRGLAAQNPHLAKDLFDENAENIDTKHRAQLDTYLTNRILVFDRAQEVEERRAEKERQAQEKEAIKGTQEQVVQLIGQGKLSEAKKLALNSNLPAVGEGSQEHFLRFIDARAEHQLRMAQDKPIKTNPNVMLELFDRTHLPDGDPRKITDENQYSAAYIGKQLTFEDLNRLRTEFRQMRTPDGERLSDTRKQFLDGIRPRFDSSTMLNIDADGRERYYKFTQFVADQETQQRKAGKSPYDLYNPNSPDYLGNKTGAFQATLEQQIRTIANRMQGDRQMTHSIGSLPQIKSDAEYKALKPGSEFIDPNGVRRRKP